MEVLSKKTTKFGVGHVVREFLPSRIERQVLAQVFELVCGPWAEADELHSTRLHAAQGDRVSESELMTDAVVAGGRAA